MNIQVLGDSYATRFINFLESGQPGTEKFKCIYGKGISGATVSVLKAYVKTHRTALNGTVPLLLFFGTNDYFANVQPIVFKQAVKAFLRFFRTTYPDCTLVFCTLPKYPRVGNSVFHIQRLQKINNFLLTLRSETVRVIKLPDNFSSSDYFHAFYGRSLRRDEMHLNQKAYSELLPILRNSLDR